jgi:hypothetical protein
MIPCAVRTSTRQELLPVAILGALGVLASGLMLYAGRHTIFFFDEWDFVLGRRGMSVDTLLDPHVGHLSLVPILIYKTLLAVVGLDPYWPYRVCVLLLHLLCVALFYAVAARRLGSWPALGLSICLLFLGSAWEVVLWPFEISYLASLAAGLGAWLLLQQEARRRDVAASVLLGIALASSGVGVPVALGLLAGLVLVPGRRRRAWLVAPPLALYVVWLLGWGLPADTPEKVDLANLPDAPRYMAEMAASAAGGLTGLGEGWGRILIAAFAAAVAVRIVRRGLSPWLAAGLVSAIAFWVLTALARADVSPASSSRYIYPSVVFLLLVAVELPGAADWWRAWVGERRTLWALAAGAVVLAAVANAAPLRDGARSLRAASSAVRPALAALEVGGPSVDPGFRPEQTYAPQIAAGPYLAAVADFGSALPDGVAGELRRAGGAAAVDAALTRAEAIGVAPPAPDSNTASSPPRVVEAITGSASVERGCIRFTPAGAPAALDVEAAPATTLLVRSRGSVPTEVRIRRFATDFPAPALGSATAQGPIAIAFPRDTRSEPWTVRLSPAQPVLACLAG